MKKNTWLIITLVAVIFVSGGVTGFFTGRMTMPKRSRKWRKFKHSKQEMKARFQQHICKKLKLTDEQKKTAEPAIEKWLNKMDELRKKHAPLYLDAFNNFYAEISPILSEEQKNILDKMQKRFSKHSSNPPPPPPPHFDNTNKGTDNETKK